MLRSPPTALLRSTPRRRLVLTIVVVAVLVALAPTAGARRRRVRADVATSCAQPPSAVRPVAHRLPAPAANGGHGLASGNVTDAADATDDDDAVHARFYDAAGEASGPVVTGEDVPTQDPSTPPVAPADPVAPAIDLEMIERDLAGVEAALRRLDDGSYWTDEITGEPLDERLLLADPVARRNR